MEKLEFQRVEVGTKVGCGDPATDRIIELSGLGGAPAPSLQGVTIHKAELGCGWLVLVEQDGKIAAACHAYDEAMEKTPAY